MEEMGRILIIEDEPLWQELLREPLQSEYQVTVASDSTEAKAILDAAKEKERPFHLVTVDIGLPGSRGEKLLCYICQHHREAKCVVVTGDPEVTMTDVRNYFKEYEVFDFVQKVTFDPAQFRKIIDRAFHINGYKILNEIGRGATSVVYEARDPQGRLVALKVFYCPSGLTEEAMRRQMRRFAMEVEVKRLKHPNIVIVYDYCNSVESEQKSFIVMEYLKGQTLASLLAVERTLSLERALGIASQIGEALDYAHSQNVIHRDIKPSNIMLLPGDRVKVTDFGIAKRRDTSLTMTSEMVGTLAYMAPEQIISSKHVDHRADIYSVGVVLYEMVTGCLPFEEPMQKLADGPPLPPRDFNSALPEGVESVILTALAKNPEGRYQSATDMVQALEALYRQEQQGRGDR